MSDLGFRTLDVDWYGEGVPGTPQWRLALEGADLVLRGRVQTVPVRVHGDSAGRFVEGLWEGDLVEVFLHNPANAFYLELNLAPGGAYWACGHTAPRVRVSAGAAPLEGARTRIVAGDGGWDATLRVPVASLPKELAFDPETTCANVTFCLGTPQRYLTATDLGGGVPDFHRPQAWGPLKTLLCEP